jgi:hypothetical protein
LFNAWASADAVPAERLLAPADAVEAAPVSEVAPALDVDEALLSASLISFKAEVRSVTPLSSVVADVLAVVDAPPAEDAVSCSEVRKRSRSELNWPDGLD